MNPSLKLFLILIISLEITFTTNLWVNIIIICLALAFLVKSRFNWHQYIWLISVPFFPALALLITIGCFTPGHDWHYGWVLVSRLYVYVSLGTFFTHTTATLDLARSLEQNWHLPSKYAYGVLAAFNLIPRMKQTVKAIYSAGRMRGVNLHWWSPTLYFKAFFAAIQWSDQLAQAMESHGFQEGASRTFAQPISLQKKDWLIFIGAIIGIQVLLIALP